MMEPPISVLSLSPAEMQILVSRTGLVLNPGQVADLVLAWRQVAALIGSIPRDRPFADDLAIAFRLPPSTPLSGLTSRKPPDEPAQAQPGKPARSTPKPPARAAPKKSPAGMAASKVRPGSPVRNTAKGTAPKRAPRAR